MSKGIEYLEDSIYGFHDNGIMATGWFQEMDSYNKDWYFFNDNGKAYDGWLGDFYINSGAMVTGLYEIDNKQYLFGENGHLESTVALVNGWNLVDGQYYYLENNLIQDGWKFINNYWYYFNENTYEMQSEIFYTPDGSCYYAENGKLVQNRWVLNDENNNWIYAGDNGRLKNNEWSLINGEWYYFDNYNMIDNDFITNDTLYYIAQNGVYTGETKLSQNEGWVYTYDGWCFIQNGNKLEGWQYINNSWYFFAKSKDTKDGVGYAVKPGFMFHGLSYIDEATYLFAENGIMVANGWGLGTKYNNEAYWYYADESGKLMNGWQFINNNWYYFAPQMYSNGIFLINGKNYEFDSNGVYVGERNLSNGWMLYNENWYYYRDGVKIAFEWLNDNGNYYFFDSFGRMMTEEDDLRFSANGILKSNQWILRNEHWYYINSNGQLYRKGNYMIDGVIYRFDSKGSIV